jgi:ribosomal protein S18 acetylase RimI-like enzyme
MQIRDADPADTVAIATVARASWHAAYDDLLGADTVDATVDDWYAADSLQEEIAAVNEDDDTVFLVGEQAGEIEGFATAGPVADGERSPARADAFVSRLYVDPDCWGRGIGTALIRRVTNRLQEAGHERVWLEVFAENDAGRGFYESLGFERVGAVEEPFGDEERTTIHLAMDVSDLLAAVTD